jgi:hypothetical protein
MGKGGHRENVYATCSDYVGFLAPTPNLIWRIVPCVYKIYTLGRFHGLLGTLLGGGCIGCVKVIDSSVVDLKRMTGL